MNFAPMKKYLMNGIFLKQQGNDYMLTTAKIKLIFYFPDSSV